MSSAASLISRGSESYEGAQIGFTGQPTAESRSTTDQSTARLQGREVSRQRRSPSDTDSCGISRAASDFLPPADTRDDRVLRLGADYSGRSARPLLPGCARAGE